MSRFASQKTRTSAVWLCLLLAFSIVFVGCNQQNPADSSTNTAGEEVSSPASSVASDPGYTTIDMMHYNFRIDPRTAPMQVETIIEEAEDRGIIVEKDPSDQHLIYTIEDDTLQEMLDDLRQDIEDQMSFILTRDNPNVTDITYNDTLNLMDFTVDREQHQSDSLEQMYEGMLMKLLINYQVLTQQNLEIEIRFIDDETGDAYGNYTWTKSQASAR